MQAGRWNPQLRPLALLGDRRAQTAATRRRPLRRRVTEARSEDMMLRPPTAGRAEGMLRTPALAQQGVTVRTMMRRLTVFVRLRPAHVTLL